MSSKIRNVALLLPALVLATGLASAQPTIRVTSTNPDGSKATTTLDSSNGPAARTPAVGRYWDGLSSTDYYNRPPFIAAPPNPQIAVGPDDIFTIVNRTIARYPNPNAGGAGLGTTVPNPYLNPPTEQAWLDVWLGLTNLAPQGGTIAGSSALCPSGQGNNATCVIDNASIRYDQLQGRFVVVFTVTDMPAHRSNVVVIVSRYSQFTKCSSTTPTPPTCAASSPLFTPPVIAPIVGGTQTGGQNGANWILYRFPVNLTYRADNAGNSTEIALGVGRVSTPNTITTGGVANINFLTTPFCTNGGPAVNTAGAVPARFINGVINPIPASCTNYFPTAARMGFDNDNLILAIPVLDMAFSGSPILGGVGSGTPDGVPEGTLATAAGQRQGVYAGTRVITVPKLMLYNGTAFSTTDQPPVCTTANPISCLAVNLADDVYTGTVTVAPGFGGGVNTVNATLASCAVAIPPFATVGVGATLYNRCATTFEDLFVPTVTAAGPPQVLGAPPGPGVLPIFFEPDNLRGRALASFDAQVSNGFNLTSGIIAPFDYLVGTAISGNFGAGYNGNGPQYFLQPIIFSCPGVAIFPGKDGVAFCGATSASQVADIPVLGTMRSNTVSQLAVSDPAPVGQGFSAQQLTTNPLNVPVTGTANSRLFVGDSRPQQVMFREGLLYVARTVRSYDLFAVPLNSSTVLYELIKTCAAGGPVGTNGNTAPNCTGAVFSPIGGNITAAVSALTGIWHYATNVPDPQGNPAGFGFYQPMFESPADVVNSLTGGPTPPTNEFPWLENVFVGMTTGGTSNVASTFSKNYPSLWDFRPGDDAYDTILPYIDPFTGLVRTGVPCPGDIPVVATVTRGSSTITVADATGLQVGMYLISGAATSGNPTQITAIVPNGTGGATITLSNSIASPTNTTGSGNPPAPPVTLTFSLNLPGQSFTITQIVNGSNQITVNSANGLQIGMRFANTGTQNTTALIPVPQNQLVLPGTANVGVGEVVTGRTSTVTSTTTAGSLIVIVPSTAPVAVGQVVTGTGITAAPATTVVAIGPNGADTTTLQVTLNQVATASGTGVTLTFNSASLFTAGTLVSAPPAINGVTDINPAATNPTNGNNAVPITLTANYNGGANSFFATAPTIINISGTTVTLDQFAIVTDAQFPNVGNDGRHPVNAVDATFGGPAATRFPTCSTPNPAGGSSLKPCSTNLPASVLSAGTNGPATVCPMIPFSSRGGASTDPNDGSLWLYGEFAKNRLSTIPGPGEWGTSVANYPLTFPATDTYNNDNTFFQDVQPGNVFFTWIQIAKNVGLAQPALTGPCTINNGGTPIQQPPAPGTTPTPGTSQLICPYFGPDTIVTRAEMAYWVVRSQMDETMVSNYLCATGGDPTGLAPGCPTSGGTTAAIFADEGGIVNPFISVPTLGFPGVTGAQLIRYIEVMARRGYTKGCSSTNDPLYRYCPNDPVKRQEMAVFLIRAKMSNVFPTQLSGTPLSGVYGDNFGLFQQTPSYFSDVTTAATDPAKDYYIYVQKMRELRITNGTSGSTFSPAQSLTRKEIATFVIRAFFL